MLPGTKGSGIPDDDRLLIHERPHDVRNQTILCPVPTAYHISGSCR